VIGRPFGSAETDVAEHEFHPRQTPAHEWFGIGSTARVARDRVGGARQFPAPAADARESGVAEGDHAQE